MGAVGGGADLLGVSRRGMSAGSLRRVPARGPLRSRDALPPRGKRSPGVLRAPYGGVRAPGPGGVPWAGLRGVRAGTRGGGGVWVPAWC